MKRRSLLQSRILFQLSNVPAPTITELAKRVKGKRPSVSRSLHKLEEQGLVWLSEDGWTLTPKGRQEIPTVQEKLASLAKEFNSSAERVSRLIGGIGLSALDEHLQELQKQTQPFLSALETRNEAIDKLYELSQPWVLSEQAGKFLTSSMAGIAEQLQLASPLTELEEQLRLETPFVQLGQDLAQDRLAETEVFLAKALADAESIRNFDDLPVTKLARQLLASDALELGRSAAESVIQKFSEAATANIGRSLGEIISLPEVTVAMESAIGPLLRTQELNSTLLSNLAFAPQVTALEELAKWNNQLLAGAIDDSLAVRSEVLTNWPRIAEEVGFQSLLPDMVGINTAYEQLIRENTGHLVLEPPRASYMEYIAPTVAMRGYAASVRDLIESESAPVPYGSYDWSSQYPEGRVLSSPSLEGLDDMLASLDRSFATMRRGYWHALNSRGPDYLRQAAVSQRELLVKVFEYLVPKSSLPTDLPSRTRTQLKERIKYLMAQSESDREFADAFSKALIQAYDQLSKYTHGNPRHESALRGILTAGEGFLFFVLSQWGER